MGGDGVELSWWPKERPRSPEREPLSRDQIVEAAIRLIDRDGLEALSMRRLADELHVSVTSVYWRVRNKEELLVLVVDALAGDVNAVYEASPGSSWRDRAATFARAVRRVVREEHPNAALLFLPRMALGPNVIRGMDLLLGALRGTGIPDERLYFAYWSLLTYAYGAAIREAATVTADPDSAARHRVDLAAALPADTYPNVVALASSITAGRLEEQFEYGLQRVLDGIELASREENAER